MAGGAGVVAWFVLGRTRLGLALRAAGESASTADAAGHSVAGLRLGAVATGGALAGTSGAYLTLSLTPQWAEGIVAGRGWIAVALVIFGAWRPGRVALGALLFGLTLALKTRLQTFGVDFSPILLSMLPYLLTVGVLVAISIRARNRPSPAPAALGIAYRREDRCTRPLADWRRLSVQLRSTPVRRTVTASSAPMHSSRRAASSPASPAVPVASAGTREWAATRR